MKILRWPLIGLGILLYLVGYCWFYTVFQLNIARSKGVYATAEEGMLTQISQYYPADRTVKILYAGTNSFDGSQPYIWYVITEVRAASRLDGSPMNHNGCDSGGAFYLQTKQGWVHVSEGVFPTFIGFWMKVFDMSGEGQSTPSTNWAPDQPAHYCQ